MKHKQKSFKQPIPYDILNLFYFVQKGRMQYAPTVGYFDKIKTVHYTFHHTFYHTFQPVPHSIHCILLILFIFMMSSCYMDAEAIPMKEVIEHTQMVPPVLAEHQLFHLLNTKSGIQEHVDLEATCVSSSEHGYFWVETGLEDYFTIYGLNKLCEQFDKQMYEMIERQFAPICDLDNNGKVHVLFANFEDELSHTGGYFSPSQMKPDTYTIGGEIIFINLNTLTDIKYIARTIVHELQHLAFFNQNILIEENRTQESPDMLFEVDNDTWINEGLSQMAEWVYEANEYDMELFTGFSFDMVWYYADYIQSSFIAADSVQNGYPLLKWGQSWYDYKLSELFFVYLTHQSTCSDFYKVLNLQERELPYSVADAAVECGIIEEGQDFRDLFEQWLLANLFYTESGKYSYPQHITAYRNHWLEPRFSLFYSSLRDHASLYPGSALYFPMKPGHGFAEPSFGTIVYVGINSETQELDYDETDGYEGDILLVYNYRPDPTALVSIVSIPSDDMIRTE